MSADTAFCKPDRFRQIGYRIELASFHAPTLAAGDTVELQGYFRVADGYFAADRTSFWGCKVG